MYVLQRNKPIEIDEKTGLTSKYKKLMCADVF